MPSTFKNQALSVVDISTLAEDTSPDMTNDTTIIRDVSLSTTYKVALENLGHSYKTKLSTGDYSTTSNTVPTNMTALAVDLLPGNIYKIQLYCFGIAAATTTGVRIRVSYTSNNVAGSADFDATVLATSSSTIAYYSCNQTTSAPASLVASTYSTTVPGLYVIETTVGVLGTSTVTATPGLLSEVSGSNVTVKAGSCIVYQCIGRVGGL